MVKHAPCHGTGLELMDRSLPKLFVFSIIQETPLGTEIVRRRVNQCRPRVCGIVLSTLSHKFAISQPTPRLDVGRDFYRTVVRSLVRPILLIINDIVPSSLFACLL